MPTSTSLASNPEVDDSRWFWGYNGLRTYVQYLGTYHVYEQHAAPTAGTAVGYRGVSTEKDAMIWTW